MEEDHSTEQHHIGLDVREKVRTERITQASLRHPYLTYVPLTEQHHPCSIL
jgi:hypothetical protein